MAFSEEIRQKLIAAQKMEVTEYLLFKVLVANEKDAATKAAFEQLAAQELAHTQWLAALTQIQVSPSRIKIFFYVLISKLFGRSFGVRLMEKREASAQKVYEELRGVIPGIDKVIAEEAGHEERLLSLISQEELKYTGSIILGLNDALVELTGVLAGLTFALQQTRIVAVAGLITGLAASLAMAGSEYLSTKEEGTRNPLKAGAYTGFAYIQAVCLLVAPYFLFANHFVCLAATLITAILIIFVFAYYTSIAKRLSFKHRFAEMMAIGLGVAAINFGVGLLVRRYLGIEI